MIDIYVAANNPPDSPCEGCTTAIRLDSSSQDENVVIRTNASIGRAVAKIPFLIDCCGKPSCAQEISSALTKRFMQQRNYMVRIQKEIETFTEDYMKRDS